MRKEDIKKMYSDADRRFGYSMHEVGEYREAWRIFRIMAEFVEGYQFLRGLKREVTILGSARTKEGNPYYQTAKKLGQLLAEGGFTTITGGGPGIMEAANRGAFEAKGESVGLNIELPFEQVLNPYVTKFASFNYFFTRKVMLTSPANAFVFFPGGFGTMDEFFEVVDLMSLQMLQEVPIVLVGKDYWQPLLDFLKGSACRVGSLQPEQIDAWHLVETAEEAYELIKDVPDIHAETCHLSPNNFQCDGDIDWKVFRIMSELVEGFEFLTGVSKNITVLGTKTLEEGTHYYAVAEELGKRLAGEKYAVVTGGKMGIAEAANKGAFEADGESIGLGMSIARDGGKNLNTYLTKSLNFAFPFTRKLIVTAPSEGFVFFPGGFGTMHQLFEVLTLMQTKKMPVQPVILVDREFWQPLHHYIKSVFVHDTETVSPEDDEMYQIVDDIDGVMKVLADARS